MPDTPASLSLRERLVLLFLSSRRSLRFTECWKAQPEPRPAFRTVQNAIYRLYAQGVIARVGHGRYALSRCHPAALKPPDRGPGQAR